MSKLLWVVSGILILAVAMSAACDDGDSSDGDGDADGDTDGDTDGDGDPLDIDDPLYRDFTDTVAEWITPDYYTCEWGDSACGGMPCPSDDLWVAINPTDFRSSATCCACMLVEGPRGSVTVEVIENCAGACADGEIELSRTAFDAIADLDEGHADVRWRLVPCERAGPIVFSYEPDSHEWWAGIQIRNPALPVAGLSIRISDDEGWRELTRGGWDHFDVSADLGSGPFDFIVTAIDGQEIHEENIAYVPGDDVAGTGQFDI